VYGSGVLTFLIYSYLEAKPILMGKML